MPKFIVEVSEVYKTCYLVEADSKEEAITKWDKGDHLDELAQEYSYTLDSNRNVFDYDPKDIWM